MAAPGINFKTNLEQVLHVAFPGSYLSITPLQTGRFVVKIVSGLFNGEPEPEKQQRVWDVLKTRLGPEATNVSVVIVYGDDEL